MEPGSLNLVEASIADLQQALSTGALTSVDLVARYLRRISVYDGQDLALNAIPILNTKVFDEAAASDDRRASGAPPRHLEGIPYTVKDSYKVKGMTAASGSPAFKDLVANEDAFTVAAIREAGGVLIGRTNMPPMAYGGMQRGVYGRAENPYNKDFLAAAWASGSSNGSAVSTAASMAAFGMGEETVSSGRSPASNNALVAYTPSKGWISIRGNWPLYPTCDVVVPHTRTMDDMLRLLEVVTARDPSTTGDFWRDQPFVKLAEPWGGLDGPDILRTVSSSRSLEGIRVAVPDMYIGGASPEGAIPVFTSDEVQRLWRNAKRQLEALDAEVVVVPDFPVVTGYENPEMLPDEFARLPDDWNSYERGALVAHGWETFLRENADPKISSLAAVDERTIWPPSMRTEAELHHLPARNAIHWGKLAGYTHGKSIYETENLDVAVRSLELMRKQLCDDYLARHGCHCFAFPSQGDVGAADADVNPEAAAHAWRNGVWYSNGNRALRHLGVPSVTVPMGVIEDKEVPVGLTFAGRAYDDVDLLRWANAFEKRTRLRTVPKHTPPLESDVIDLRQGMAISRAKRPVLQVSDCKTSSDGSGYLQVVVEGTVQLSQEPGRSPILEVIVNGQDVPKEQVSVNMQNGNSEGVVFAFRAVASTRAPPQRDDRERTMVPVARDKTMVIVLARAVESAYPSGHLALV